MAIAGDDDVTRPNKGRLPDGFFTMEYITKAADPVEAAKHRRELEKLRASLPPDPDGE